MKFTYCQYKKHRSLKTISAVILFAFVLSSCDKKNALLVNRRTVTFKRIKEDKDKKKAELQRLVDDAHFGLGFINYQRLLDILYTLPDANDCRPLINILSALNNPHYYRNHLITILYTLPANTVDRHDLITILYDLPVVNDNNNYLIDVFRATPLPTPVHHNGCLCYFGFDESSAGIPIFRHHLIDVLRDPHVSDNVGSFFDVLKHFPNDGHTIFFARFLYNLPGNDRSRLINIFSDNHLHDRNCDSLLHILYDFQELAHAINPTTLVSTIADLGPEILKGRLNAIAKLPCAARRQLIRDNKITTSLEILQ